LLSEEFFVSPKIKQTKQTIKNLTKLQKIKFSGSSKQVYFEDFRVVVRRFLKLRKSRIF